MTVRQTNAPPPANDAADPYATAASALDWLYMLRRGMLKVDHPGADLTERREQHAVLAQFAEVEQLLLAEL